MQPGKEKGSRLARAILRGDDPEAAHHLQVIGLAPRHGKLDPRRGHMRDQEKGQGETKSQLGRLTPGHAQRTTAVQGLQG